MIRSSLKPSSKPKTRTCKNRACRNKFVPARPLQVACCIGCAIILSKQKIQKDQAEQAKKERKADSERKKELKPLHYWAKRAEKACNAFIRVRDAGDPCISCGTYDAPEWHAGHCYTVAARSDIRYHEDNIHLQCPKCNTYQGGMVGEYKKRVVSKIGQERFDALAYVNPAAKKTREYYQEVEAYYKAKLRALVMDKGVE